MSPLPTALSKTPQPTRTASAASSSVSGDKNNHAQQSQPYVLAPLDEKQLFDRITTTISRSAGGLVRNEFIDEKIAVAVRDISLLQRARDTSHVSKVEPPRSFHSVHTPVPDHLRDLKGAGRRLSLDASSSSSTGESRPLGVGSGSPLPIAGPQGFKK